MTAEHNDLTHRLGRRLDRQLDEREFDVRTTPTRLRTATSCRIPDICVLPRAAVLQKLNQSGQLEIYDEPVHLVIEVWSPSTGEDDLGAKLNEYQQRGDWEIWSLHPIHRTLIAWRRQPDGSYTETLLLSGVVQPVALPGVRIDLDDLFA